ncbi:hypothetical protein [Paenarthrobacter sp. PH39-S1]|uniref:hypothetical protein n=1 Tax=Paenarthrobacter sp. PH39-S1 TaxID=3046204 RepID=UPI0024BB0C19|nr:hypothetical protein [Paenarthrobacter sp. PH39-S1]MDJ0354896.1 hypothetical protein [Paenarthrobacter sp. PH39-S1]
MGQCQPDSGDGGFILRGGGVAQGFLLEELGEQPSHDFAGAGLGNTRNNDDGGGVAGPAGSGNRLDCAGTPSGNQPISERIGAGAV